MDNNLKDFCDELKIFADNNKIPILTVNGELEELFYRQQKLSKKYKPIGTSNKLINIIDNTITLK